MNEYTAALRTAIALIFGFDAPAPRAANYSAGGVPICSSAR